MLNPFKKKDNSYSLDSMTLPTLNSQPDSNLNESPQIPNNSTLPPSNPIPDFSNHPASTDSLDNSQIAQENPFKEQSSFPQTQSFQNSPMDSVPQQDSMNSLPTQQQANSDLSKIQLETLDKKVSLLDSRMSMIEDKIEKIYQMISLEVGPETKMRAEMNANKK